MSEVKPGALPFKRTSRCGDLRESHAGDETRLFGWVATVRDLGALVFVDLRDREGLAQVVFRKELNEAAFAAAKGLHLEDVVGIAGTVRRRSAGNLNPHMATG